MKVIWQEVDGLAYEGMGHGLLFFAEGSASGDDAPRSNDSLVAVLRNYDWLHRRPVEAVVEIRPPDKVFGADFLQAARSDIEGLILHPERLPRLQGWLSARIYVHPNG